MNSLKRYKIIVLAAGVLLLPAVTAAAEKSVFTRPLVFEARDYIYVDNGVDGKKHVEIQEDPHGIKRVLLHWSGIEGADQEGLKPSDYARIDCEIIKKLLVRAFEGKLVVKGECKKVEQRNGPLLKRKIRYEFFPELVLDEPFDPQKTETADYFTRTELVFDSRKSCESGANILESISDTRESILSRRSSVEVKISAQCFLNALTGKYSIFRPYLIIRAVDLRRIMGFSSMLSAPAPAMSGAQVNSAASKQLPEEAKDESTGRSTGQSTAQSSGQSQQAEASGEAASASSSAF